MDKLWCCHTIDYNKIERCVTTCKITDDPQKPNVEQQKPHKKIHTL